MDINVKDAREVAEGLGMNLFVSEYGTIRLYYNNLDIPDELSWIEAVIGHIKRCNPGIRLSITEIHQRKKNPFKKDPILGVLINVEKS